MRFAASALIALACGMAAVPALAQQEAFRAFTPQDIRWTQRKSNPDVFHAALHGDQAAAGPYAYRIRAQAGHVLAPHTHPDERTVTVISGTYWSAIGTRFERANLVAYPAGSFYVIPAGVPHYSAVLEGETVFQEAGIGPSRVDILPGQ